MLVKLTADVPVVPSAPSCDNSAIPKVSLLNIAHFFQISPFPYFVGFNAALEAYAQ
jgi:hypothetical protein